MWLVGSFGSCSLGLFKVIIYRHVTCGSKLRLRTVGSVLVVIFNTSSLPASGSSLLFFFVFTSFLPIYSLGVPKTNQPSIHLPTLSISPSPPTSVATQILQGARSSRPHKRSHNTGRLVLGRHRSRIASHRVLALLLTARPDFPIASSILCHS